MKKSFLCAGLILPLAACSPSQEQPSDAPVAAAGSSAASASGGEARAQLEDLVADLVKDHHDAEVGIALTDAQGALATGAPGKGPAWSTIKVPIAITALRNGASTDLVDAAIKESDNDAAYALWSKVKWSEDNATAAIDEVLAEGGSKATWQKPDANGDVSFGYAEWLLKDQATFAAHLNCVANNKQVSRAMGDIVEWQQYGLTALDNTRAKGGWGFDEDSGRYTQRQFGVLDIGDTTPGEHGSIGIAMTVVFHDMDDFDSEQDAYDDTVKALDDAASDLKDMISEGIDDGTLTPVHDCDGLPRAQATSAPERTLEKGASVSAATSTEPASSSRRPAASSERN
ncbi:hypothetical protein [Corynebacterium sp. SA-MJD20WY100]|uniref:hypothetical protein n=1 Tax=Corynebacterium sp. SA-MJD20WY100 TaxID=3142969 RepID=UPI003221592D